HFSLYGAGFDSRLITQMYFEGDPLLRQDRMLLGIPDVRGQDRLIAKLEDAASVIDVINTANAASPMDETGRLVARSPLIASTPPAGRNESALAYRFDIVLRGSGATPLEDRE
ncbi:dioxygenase family protein, partial [Bosea thiooxidans]